MLDAPIVFWFVKTSFWLHDWGFTHRWQMRVSGALAACLPLVACIFGLDDWSVPLWTVPHLFVLWVNEWRRERMGPDSYNLFQITTNHWWWLVMIRIMASGFLVGSFLGHPLKDWDVLPLVIWAYMLCTLMPPNPPKRKIGEEISKLIWRPSLVPEKA